MPTKAEISAYFDLANKSSRFTPGDDPDIAKQEGIVYPGKNPGIKYKGNRISSKERKNLARTAKFAAREFLTPEEFIELEDYLIELVLSFEFPLWLIAELFDAEKQIRLDLAKDDGDFLIENFMEEKSVLESYFIPLDQLLSDYFIEFKIMAFLRLEQEKQQKFLRLMRNLEKKLFHPDLHKIFEQEHKQLTGIFNWLEEDNRNYELAFRQNLMPQIVYLEKKYRLRLARLDDEYPFKGPKLSKEKFQEEVGRVEFYFHMLADLAQRIPDTARIFFQDFVSFLDLVEKGITISTETEFVGQNVVLIDGDVFTKLKNWIEQKQ